MSIRGFRVSRPASSAPPSGGPRLGTTLFGLVFAGFALFMGSMILRQHREARAILEWTPTPCTIEKSAIDSVGEGQYAFSATYRYDWKGRALVGRLYRWKSDTYTFDSVAEKGPLLRRYPADIATTCYVNPANPAEAVLTRGDGAFPWPMLLFLVPFVAVGLGVAFGPWIARARKRRAGGFESPTEKSKATKRTGRGILIVFGLVFAGAGVGVGTQLLPNVAQWRASSAWTEVPAVVTASAVRSHRGDDSTTYKPYIAYVYTVDGVAYENDRYDFWGVSSSGYEGKAAIVQAHPVGREIRIFVDPTNPAQSVISRQAGGGILFHTLFPLVFFGVGCGILVAGLRAGRTGRSAASHAGFAPARDAAPDPYRPAIQKANRGRAVGAVVFALAWNAFLSVFLFVAWQGVQSGRPQWGMIVFLIPFVIIGLAALVGVVAEILRLFNPKIAITADGAGFFLDRPIRLRYRASGSMNRVASLTITLEGVEKVTIHSGKSTRTSERMFFQTTMLETTDPTAMLQGEVETALPPHVMHSFRSDRASVEWRVKIAGVVSLWPDIREEIRLEVRPTDRRLA